MGDRPKIQVTERKVEISHDKYAAQAHVRQFITTTLEISTATIEVSETGRGFAGSSATGRNQYQKTDRVIEDLKEDLKNLTFPLNQNKSKDK